MRASPDSGELGAVIADFLRAAETGRVRREDGAPYSRGELRALRGALSHVASELGSQGVDTISAWQVQSLLARLADAGLPPPRVGAIVDALRSLYAYAIQRGLVTTSPVVGLATGDDDIADADAPTHGAATPTDAMLQLGERVAAWTVRGTVVAFVLFALVLGLALA
jgi:site-specific recombinase XerD